MSKSARTTNAMEIRLRVLWKIKIDNDIHSLNVDTACEKIGAHQVSADSISEVVKHTVAMVLKHFCVRIEAGIPKFSNFLSQEFHTIRRIAKYDGLIDL